MPDPVRIVIMAVDLDKTESEGGTDEKISDIIKLAKEKEIPIAFSCLRKELGVAQYGRRLKVQPRVSVLAIVNCTGYEKVRL